MSELRTDLKIFTGSSGLALLFALFLSIFKGQAARHLLPISIALTCATFIAALWYTLGQNWVTTILFSSYWGWVYSFFLAFLSTLLIDIAANKARITSFIFNIIGNLLNTEISYSPC